MEVRISMDLHVYIVYNLCAFMRVYVTMRNDSLIDAYLYREAIGMSLTVTRST